MKDPSGFVTSKGRAPFVTFALVASFTTAGVAAVACSTSSPPEPSVDASTNPSALTRQQLLDPTSCKGCHADHYREWSGSMHAYAAEDPVFLALNRKAQRESGGAVGAFCIPCHAPMALREGATKDGLNLAEVPASLKGVTCFFCHSTDAVEGTHNNPLKLASDNALRGPITNPLPSPAHASTYSELFDRERPASSAMCGSCHDVVTPKGDAIERTYYEWLHSAFSQPQGATCNQCHMEGSRAEGPVAAVEGAPSRRRHSHAFPGVDVALTPFPETETQKSLVQASLNATLSTSVCVAQSGPKFSLRVVADNVGAGHSFPSGAASNRRVWFEVVAYEQGKVIYESGTTYNGNANPSSTSDADLWALRDCLFDEGGGPVPHLWQASSHEGFTLPAVATTNPRDPRFYQTHFVKPFPDAGTIPGTPDRVTLRVRVQPVGRDILDNLVASGDLDPAVRDAMPTFDIGAAPVLEWTPESARGVYYEDRTTVRCATASNMNVAVDKVPAPRPDRCRR